jgi:ABC-type molybdate transport system permease subunit
MDDFYVKGVMTGETNCLSFELYMELAETIRRYAAAATAGIGFRFACICLFFMARTDNNDHTGLMRRVLGRAA